MTIEFPLVPVGTVIVVGEAETEKSMTVTVTVVEWLSAPLVPVTVTV